MLISNVFLLTTAGMGVIFTSKFGVGFSTRVRSGWRTDVPNVVKHPFQTKVQPSLKEEADPEASVSLLLYGACSFANRAAAKW